MWYPTLILYEHKSMFAPSQPYWQHTLILKASVPIYGVGNSLRSSAAKSNTWALSSFQWAQSLNYRSKVKTGSPEYAYLPGSLEAAQVSTPSWQSIIGHMGRAPEHLPATPFTQTMILQQWADEERRHSSSQQWVTISLAVDFLIYISMLACHLKGITFAIRRQQADIW